MKGKNIVSKIKTKIDANRFLSCVFEIVTRCFSHNIFGMGAELAYYFLFSFLPLIIFGSSLLRWLPKDIDFSYLTQFIPADVMGLVRNYVDYINENKSVALMYSGLVLSIYFASSAVRSLMRSLDKAYDVKKRRHPIKQFIISIFFAVVFLVMILCSILLMLAGGAIIDFVITIFPQVASLGWLLHILRFFIMIFPIWGVLMLLYLFTPNRKLTIRSSIPGAFFSMATWMGVSAIFSTYVSSMGKYQSLYGTFMGAIIVLMLWLYITGLIFIAGGELNFVFLRRREKKAEKEIADRVEKEIQNKNPPRLP